jgi:hypothetical protein
MVITRSKKRQMEHIAASAAAGPPKHATPRAGKVVIAAEVSCAGSAPTTLSWDDVLFVPFDELEVAAAETQLCEGKPIAEKKVLYVELPGVLSILTIEGDASWTLWCVCVTVSKALEADPLLVNLRRKANGELIDRSETMRSLPQGDTLLVQILPRGGRC